LIRVLGFIASSLVVCSALSADFKWSGRYRWEGVSLRNSNLENGGTSKAYMLHHLILEPTIVAADGLNIYGRFDILNSANPLYANSQFGQFFGRGPGSSTVTPTDTTNSNVVSQSQSSDTIAINSLYLAWIQEFAALMVGRMPVQFGLGMTHNSGAGEFDHWMDTKDLVGYKMVFGNLFLMPMLGKVNEGNLEQEDDVNDYMLHFQYDNRETKLSMGAFYEARIGTRAGGNDAPTATYGGGTVTDGWEGKQLNLFVARQFDNIDFGMEAGFQSGSTGVTSGGSVMSLQGFGIASELKWKSEGSKWKGNLRAGVATGDDPSTADKFEGYIFDRNYDVASLLFNHVVGNYDLFRSSIGGKGTASVNAADIEALSNVIYISPEFNYQMSDFWTADTRLTYATLQQSNFGTFSSDKSVGFELDLGATYKPHEHFTFGLDLSVLFPGSAFEGDPNGGANHFKKETAFGFGSKAAVSF
jgi:hypothetical protein